MSVDRTFAIVGAGLTGASAAETLRAEGFDGRVVRARAVIDRSLLCDRQVALGELLANASSSSPDQG